jgi:uroporphyrin-3 C-methyltransferase
MENDKQALTPLPEARYRMGPRWNRIFTSAALALLAVVAWQAYDSRQDIADLRSDLEHRVSESDKAAIQANALAAQRQASLEALQGRVATLETQIHEAQSQFSTIDDLHAEFARARDERMINEISQSIDIANQQLQLAGNVSASLTALQAADSRMALLDPLRYMPVRKLLARDIERLKTLPLADVPRMALQLESLIGRIDVLPLGFERKPAEAEKSALRNVAKKKSSKPAASEPEASAAADASPGVLLGLARDVWSEFRSLIRIERLDQPDPALLAPEQASYLRANLRLRLLSARVALLQSQNKLFADDVQQARGWVQRYFDSKAPLVVSTLAELDVMGRARLDIDLPNFDETQAALRNVKPAVKR